MLNRPPLLALEYFVATATLGTVRAASNQLHVTPSAVSHQIGRLEGFLNVQLFYRHKRRLILTEAGRSFLDQIDGSLSQLAQATRDTSRRDGRRHLRISVSPTFLTFFILPRLPSLLALYPELSLSFVDSLVFDPMQREIDCAIEYRVETDDRLRSEKLFDDEVVPVASPEYVASMKIASIKDSKRCLLIETEKRVYSWNSALKDYGWRGECRTLFVQYTYQALSCVALGMGIALVNRYNAGHLLREGTLVIPFELDTSDYYGPSYYFSCLPKKEAIPTVRAFRTWLCEQIATCGLELAQSDLGPLPARHHATPPPHPLAIASAAPARMQPVLHHKSAVAQRKKPTRKGSVNS